MDRRDQGFPVIVHGLAAKYSIIELRGGACVVEGFIHGLIPIGRGIGFRADRIARKVVGALAIEDPAAQALPLKRRGGRRPRAELGAEGNQALGQPHGAAGWFRRDRGRARRQTLQHVGRDDKIAGTALHICIETRWVHEIPPHISSENRLQ
jgi:hypothetical protein